MTSVVHLTELMAGVRTVSAVARCLRPSITGMPRNHSLKAVDLFLWFNAGGNRAEAENPRASHMSLAKASLRRRQQRKVLKEPFRASHT